MFHRAGSATCAGGSEVTEVADGTEIRAMSGKPVQSLTV
jgi:hypothetical protein